MSDNGSDLNQNLNSTKNRSTPSHDHLIDHAPAASDATKSDAEKLDHLGMESARRGQNRIHNNEERTPGSTIFSK